MKYKAVVCDLDGTLLNSHHTISQFTKDIINKIRAKGVKVFIATGRHYEDARVFKDMLGLDSFMITSNGAKVHNEKNEEIISHNIPVDISESIINMTIDDLIHKNMYMDNNWYVEEKLEEAEEFHKESGFNHVIKPFKELTGKEVTKFFYICEDEEKIRILEEEFAMKYRGKLNITLSLGTCLELMHRGVSKATALKEVLEAEGISMEDVIAFGDGLNDYEMLKSVGKGLIMGNGSYRLIEALPENEVIETNDEDGVAKYLTEVFL